MANIILKHEARARQSLSELHEILNNNPPNSDVFGDILRNMTFSLTFTSSQWQLFWRLLNVGSMLADQILDLHENRFQFAESDTALLWNRLSDELATLLNKGEVKYTQEKAPNMTC